MIASVQTQRPTRESHPLQTPGELALELTGRDYISYSAISTYQRCPLRYRFAYVEGLAPEFVSSSLAFGRAVHAAVEHHWRSLFEDQPPPPIDELVTTYDAAWSDHATTPIRFANGESVDSLRSLAQRLLQAFLDSPLSKLDTSIVGIEEEFRAPVIPDCPDLLGRIDLIAVDDNALRLVDFKTSRARWTETQVEEAAPQMLLYSDLARPVAEAYGNLPIRLEWIVATKTKDPSITLHTLEVDPRRVVWTKAAFQYVWQAIAAGHFYPSPSAMNCATCPYAEACRQWEG